MRQELINPLNRRTVTKTPAGGSVLPAPWVDAATPTGA